MAGQGKRHATYGRLLLLAALLFGIVTMHTVGHPAEHAAPASGMTAAHEVPAGDPVAHPSTAAPAAGLAASAGGPVAPLAAALDAHSPDGGPMSGMDPLSVCLAVLGAWGLALLGSWLLGLRALGRPLGAAAGERRLRALWPDPPPRTSVLAQVSVLRI
ncbi:hypothetical protein OHA98_30165 [Streptomyces sp. NBC_00654]|uniref:hypothetical protein n=1 Tax=Streptomyces sp. NBC_00654 TaxID=2975799 RepID=UPI002253E096|nr:hypothetical protein [Streptomyces sp. NBC_00654]MCX4968955.1 hypothetical protein [Streptomyces sp. NBC_00654]